MKACTRASGRFHRAREPRPAAEIRCVLAKAAPGQIVNNIEQRLKIAFERLDEPLQVFALARQKKDTVAGARAALAAQKALKEADSGRGNTPERQFVHRARSRLKAILPRKSDQLVHLGGSGQVPIRVWTK